MACVALNNNYSLFICGQIINYWPYDIITLLKFHLYTNNHRKKNKYDTKIISRQKSNVLCAFKKVKCYKMLDIFH